MGGGQERKMFQQRIAKKRNKNVFHCGKGSWALSLLKRRNKEQGTKNEEQETKNKEQGTRNKEQGTRNMEQETRNKEQGTWNK